jgi:hypothetical protein
LVVKYLAPDHLRNNEFFWEVELYLLARNKLIEALYVCKHLSISQDVPRGGVQCRALGGQPELAVLLALARLYPQPPMPQQVVIHFARVQQRARGTKRKVWNIMGVGNLRKGFPGEGVAQRAIWPKLRVLWWLLRV